MGLVQSFLIEVGARMPGSMGYNGGAYLGRRKCRALLWM